MRGRGARTPWLVVLVLLVGALALAAATLLRRGEDELPWGAAEPSSYGPAAPEPAAQDLAVASPPTGVTAAAEAPGPVPAAETGESVEALMLLTRQELYARAQERGIRGRSGMSKRRLAEALAGLD